MAITTTGRILNVGDENERGIYIYTSCGGVDAEQQELPALASSTYLTFP